MKMPKKEINFDSRLAKIVSYLTFDGHLSKDLKSFYLCSKNIETLNDFSDAVYTKLGVTGRLEKNTGYNLCYKYRIFSRDACIFLEKIGVCKGNKVLQSFLIPGWIKNNPEQSREYIRTAFDCEGSIWFEKQPKIRFGIFKERALIQEGIQFLEEMKSILNHFGIYCTKTWLMNGNIKKDGKITLGLYFKIRQESIRKFSEEIGFNDKFKNKRLSGIKPKEELP